jgi:alpha-1,2-mannosyltransferase
MPSVDGPEPRSANRLLALITARRLGTWATGLLVLGWGLHIYTMATPGHFDRAGRFKGTDYTQFYVMGSLLLDGRMGAFYDSSEHLAQGRRRIDPNLGVYAAHVNYGPQVALIFAPLATLPYGWSLALFLSLAAGAYALAVWLVWRDCPALHPYGRLVALLATASPLFLTVVAYAQLSTFTLLIWAAAFAAFNRKRPFAAGLALGCLVFKPTLGIVIGLAMLVGAEWRVITGALTSAAGQLTIGWIVGGSIAMGEYFSVLWRLLRSPSLVQIFPSEVHSVRGFLQLLIHSPSIVTVGSLIALVVLLVVAVRTWLLPVAVGRRYAVLALITILASPHLLTYDLILVSVPLIVFADWCLSGLDSRVRPAMSLLLVLLYLSPFSANLARAIPLQVSAIVMLAVCWCAYVGLRREEPTMRLA